MVGVQSSTVAIRNTVLKQASPIVLIDAVKCGVLWVFLEEGPRGSRVLEAANNICVLDNVMSLEHRIIDL